MKTEDIETTYKEFYPKYSECVFTAHAAAQICKTILDQQTKELQEQLAAKDKECEDKSIEFHLFVMNGFTLRNSKGKYFKKDKVGFDENNPYSIEQLYKMFNPQVNDKK